MNLADAAQGGYAAEQGKALPAAEGKPQDAAVAERGRETAWVAGPRELRDCGAGENR